MIGGKIKMRHKKTVSRNIDTNNEWIKISPIKRIQEKAPYAIELTDGNYLQMLEIRGKDLYAMGESETNRTVLNYYNWLTDFNADWTIYSTTLPTDTSIQIDYLKKRLSVCRDEIKRCKNQRLLAQLKDREHILRASIQTEEQIQKEIYNVEFILFLFSKKINELDDLTRKAKSYGSGDFLPQDISVEKKKQILKQFFNMNEKI